MPSLDLLASFVSAARHAGFAGAARDLGHSPSAVAKNVARLEAELGVRLFHRTTRQVSLTPDGKELLERCARIVDEVEALEAAAAGAKSEVRGTLRIDAPIAYGHSVVLPVLAALMTRFPQLELDARFSDHVVDIIREGLDAAIRIGPLADSRLVGRRIDEQTLLTCASPGYLARHGTPGKPEDLAQHRCLLFRLPSTGRDRPWQYRRGKRSVQWTPDDGVRLGDGESLLKLAAADLGVIQVPHYIAGPALRAGALVEVLQAYRPAPTPISLVYPSRRQMPPRVRAFADALADTLDGKAG
ncbi:MAG: LysR family transcriptional regulator [Gammaproteobacteria bacterium]